MPSYMRGSQYQRIPTYRRNRGGGGGYNEKQRDRLLDLQERQIEEEAEARRREQEQRSARRAAEMQSQSGQTIDDATQEALGIEPKPKMPLDAKMRQRGYRKVGDEWLSPADARARKRQVDQRLQTRAQQQGRKPMVEIQLVEDGPVYRMEGRGTRNAGGTMSPEQLNDLAEFKQGAAQFRDATESNIRGMEEYRNAMQQIAMQTGKAPTQRNIAEIEQYGVPDQSDSMGQASMTPESDRLRMVRNMIGAGASREEAEGTASDIAMMGREEPVEPPVRPGQVSSEDMQPLSLQQRQEIASEMSSGKYRTSRPGTMDFTAGERAYMPENIQDELNKVDAARIARGVPADQLLGGPQMAEDPAVRALADSLRGGDEGRIREFERGAAGRAKAMYRDFGGANIPIGGDDVAASVPRGETTEQWWEREPTGEELEALNAPLIGDAVDPYDVVGDPEITPAGELMRGQAEEARERGDIGMEMARNQREAQIIQEGGVAQQADTQQAQRLGELASRLADPTGMFDIDEDEIRQNLAQVQADVEAMSPDQQRQYALQVQAQPWFQDIVKKYNRQQIGSDEFEAARDFYAYILRLSRTGGR